MKIWEKYNEFVRNLILQNKSERGLSLEYWRNRLFYNTLLIFFPISVLAYIPAMIVSIKTQLWSVAVIDTVAFFSLLTVILNRNITLRFKKNFFIYVLYFLALGLLIFMGNYGPGMLYLLAVSIFSLLILGRKAGMFTFFLNTFVYLLIILVSFSEVLPYNYFGDYKPVTWTVVGINLVLLNIGLIYAVNELIAGLSNKIEKQKILESRLNDDKKKLENALIKAEESDKLKSAFLANLSHEIRTPMNGITGFAELLKPEQSNKKKEKYIEIIQNSSELLLTIIDDVVELARLDANVISLSESAFSISSLMDQFYITFNIKTKPGLKFVKLNSVPDEYDKVLGDRGKISQVLNNLLSNAFKYTKEGTVRVNSDYDPVQRRYSFEVKDTGNGISPENQEKIFHRFFQESSQSQGIGLGLSISESLTELMNGKLRLESLPGKGSTFILEIPLTPLNQK